VKKIVREMSTTESQRFWETAERAAAEVQQWPDWKRAGINVAQVLEEPRQLPTCPETDEGDDS
jgi:hypothetical protein